MNLPTPPDTGRITVVGAGRLGRAIARALSANGPSVVGPLGRRDPRPIFSARDVVLLCVPDDAIAVVAAAIPVGPFVGHCAGALTLDVLGDHHAFSMHPLLSVTDGSTSFEGAACAIAARDDDARAVARAIALRLGMDPVVVDDDVRALYHAAASMASNYLVTIEDSAERIASPTGIERRHLARLARSALENWERFGRDALTGPISRGDNETVSRQRAAVAQRVPELLALWDALAASTRALS